MPLDKAIAHGKEKRKPYTGSKRYFASCRNHGGCPWCERNRRHKFRDKHPPLGEEMSSFKDEGNAGKDSLMSAT